jgi:hypothetical protein
LLIREECLGRYICIAEGEEQLEAHYDIFVELHPFVHFAQLYIAHAVV